MANIFKEPAYTILRPLLKCFRKEVMRFVESERAKAEALEPRDIAPPRIIISTFEEYDRFLDESDALSSRICDRYCIDLEAFARQFGDIHEDDSDPYSPDYIAREIKFFEFLAGRPYSPENEGLIFEVKEEDLCFYPRGFIEYHQVILSVLSQLDFTQPKSSLELGFGFGGLLEIFGKIGCTVSGIDISPSFVEAATRRCERHSIKTGELLLGEFADVEKIDGTFDFIMFDASFHHCINPMELLSILRKKIRQDGRLLFFYEPVQEIFPRKWGIVRDDGETAYAIRRYHWLEVGIRTDFFMELLHNSGWELLDSKSLPPTCFMARPK